MEEQKTQGEKDIKKLTPEQIKGMDPMVRAALCAEDVNEVMRNFNCVFNPIAHITNQGANIQVKIIPMAYSVVAESIDPIHIQ